MFVHKAVKSLRSQKKKKEMTFWWVCACACASERGVGRPTWRPRGPPPWQEAAVPCEPRAACCRHSHCVPQSQHRGSAEQPPCSRGSAASPSVAMAGGWLSLQCLLVHGFPFRSGSSRYGLRECGDAGDGALLPLLLCWCRAPVAQCLWGTLWLSAPCSLHGYCPGSDARSSLESTRDAPTWLGALDASLIPPCTRCPCTELCGCHPCANLSGMLYFCVPFLRVVLIYRERLYENSTFLPLPFLLFFSLSCSVPFQCTAVFVVRLWELMDG